MSDRVKVRTVSPPFRSTVNQLSSGTEQSLEQGSIYVKQPSIGAYLDYQKVATYEYLAPVPRSTQFDDQSVRMVVHTSVGGHAIRVKLTNQCGSTPLEIGAASVGIRQTGARLAADTATPVLEDLTLRQEGKPKSDATKEDAKTNKAKEIKDAEARKDAVRVKEMGVEEKRR